MQVDHYQFTDGDRSSTLAAGWALFDQLELHQPGEMVRVVEPHRVAAEAVLDAVLAGEVQESEALPLVWGEWRAAMAALRRAGAYGPSAIGTTVGLFTSDGGVPKHPRQAIEISYGGVIGDRQNDRGNHGRPWQAVCLWSREVIDRFAAEGHPLAPGLAGENITMAGIEWERIVPGVHLQAGDALLEISAYSVPCRKNAAWFTDGHFGLMHHRHGHVSRAYATVLEPGRVRLADPILLEPGP
ncbi:MOSC domain-containing protein [Aquihabitans sp. McL0605]|uniref:MOSC domain-containing protein n=1 Tax=Aquihabitans sp. McL0605 TaxID=3415671 RepID=UPI003CED40D2